MRGLVRAVMMLAVVGAAFWAAGCSKKPAQEEPMPETHDTLSAASDTFIDARDGKKYRTVKIGRQTWFAENLNYRTDSSWCYNDSASYCDKYGALYDWHTAKTVCPVGWHLPTNHEWCVLVTAAGGGAAGTRLRSKSGWEKVPEDCEAYSHGYRWCSTMAQCDYWSWDCKNCSLDKRGQRWCYWPELIQGTDDFGFSALPGGRRYYIDKAYGTHDFTKIAFYDAGHEGTWWTASDYYNGPYTRRAHYHKDGMENYGYNEKAGFSVRCVMNDGEPGTEPIYRVAVLDAAARAAGDGCYFAGSTVNISAGTAPKGLRFDKWTTENGDVAIADEHSAATTFTMPASDVVVTAVFQKIRGNAIMSGDTLIDVDDGQRYKTVVIGGKRWFAQNLNYLPESGNSWCYYNYTPYCGKYGRLYDWNTARAVCPGGYHLPSSDEWHSLSWGNSPRKTLGYWDTDVSSRLQAKRGWHGNHRGNGTDSYGFAALPGGVHYYNGFGSGGEFGEWWTATEAWGFYRDNAAHSIGMGYDKYVGPDFSDKDLGLSVRCVADAP